MEVSQAGKMKQTNIKVFSDYTTAVCAMENMGGCK